MAPAIASLMAADNPGKVAHLQHEFFRALPPSPMLASLLFLRPVRSGDLCISGYRVAAAICLAVLPALPVISSGCWW